MTLNPHLSFAGECEAAFKYYEPTLGVVREFRMTYGDSPMAEHAPPAWRDKIVHATFALGQHRLTGADVPPERYQKPQGFSVLLNVEDAAEADRIFDALAAGGTVRLALQETHWAARFGILADRFGIPWTINCASRGGAEASPHREAR